MDTCTSALALFRDYGPPKCDCDIELRPAMQPNRTTKYEVYFLGVLSTGIRRVRALELATQPNETTNNEVYFFNERHG